MDNRNLVANADDFEHQELKACVTGQQGIPRSEAMRTTANVLWTR